MSTLIIGLGGTGVKTLIHVKKMLMDSNPAGSLPGDVRILAIDTRKDPETLASVGPWVGQYARRRMDQLDNVQINRNTEYYWLGGNLNGTCGQPQGEYITRWFDKRYFCALPTHDQVLNIINGAGMYRQVGRRGLFHHLQGGTTSDLYTRLQAMVIQFNTQDFRAILVGSHAGGTGASLFVDMAHLLKIIAQNNGKTAAVTAMVVLPDAFYREPHVRVDNAMRARALASMRETARFMMVHSPDLGFMMQYTDRPQDALINQRTSGSPFELVFLFEKRAPDARMEINNPLDVPLAQGVAPMLATFISKLCDGSFGAAYNAVLANNQALRSNYSVGALTSDFTSTFGVYSVVLPLAAIVEQWSIRLALETLENFVPTSGGTPLKDMPEDEKLKHPWRGSIDRLKDFIPAVGGIPLDLIPGNAKLNSTAGSKSREEAKNNPANLYHDAVDTAVQVGDGAARAAVAETIAQREPKIFRPYFSVAIPDTDDPVKIARAGEIVQRLSSAFEEMETVHYGKGKHGLFESPYKTALCKPLQQKTQTVNARGQQLHECCQAEYERLAGAWQQALDGASEWQWKDEFIPWVIRHSGEILSETGGLGWLWHYVSQEVKDLNEAINTFKDAQRKLNQEIDQLAQRGWQGGGGLVSLLDQMKKDDGKQEDYLETRQKWLEKKMREMLIDAEIKVFDKMWTYLDDLRKKLEAHWRKLVGLQDSVKDDLMTEWAVIAQKREEAQLAMGKVRTVVNDPTWEDLKYAEYFQPDHTQPSELSKYLQDLKWMVQPIVVNQGFWPDLRLRIEHLPLVMGTLLASNVIETDPVPDDQKRAQLVKNLTRCMERGRQPFQGAWNGLTVVDYYEWKQNAKNYSPESFSSELIDKGNVLMTKGMGNIPDKLDRLVYLLVPEATLGRSFLTQSLEFLVDNTGADGERSSVLTHGDPTTLAYLILDDGIEMRKIQAYTGAAQHYLGQRAFSQGVEISRSINHIFTAEQRATLYDGLENGQPKLVSPRVVMLLEDERLLSEFMLALALGVIRRGEDLNKKNNKTHYMLASVKKWFDKLGKLEEVTTNYWLSDREAPLYEAAPVEYITAAETFILRQVDYNNQPLQPLRDHVRAQVEKELQNVIQEQLPLWQAGRGTPDAVDAARSAESDTKKTRLILEARKHLYRQLYAQLKGYQPHDASLSKENEQEFVDILIRKIEQETALGAQKETALGAQN